MKTFLFCSILCCSRPGFNPCWSAYFQCIIYHGKGRRTLWKGIETRFMGRINFQFKFDFSTVCQRRIPWLLFHFITPAWTQRRRDWWSFFFFFKDAHHSLTVNVFVNGGEELSHRWLTGLSSLANAEWRFCGKSIIELWEVSLCWVCGLTLILNRFVIRV